MKQVQSIVFRELIEDCPDCGSEEVAVVGNGPYRAPRCKDKTCRWFLSAEDAVEMAKKSDKLSKKGEN
jgi:hypothetical protein